MKTYSLFILAFFISIHTFAQIENPKGFTPIQAQESNRLNSNQTLKSPESKGLSNNNGFLYNGENKAKPLEVEKEKELNMSTDNGLMTRKYDYKPNWLTKDEEIKNEYGKGMLLGTFGTKSKTIEILCRDHQYVDGDKVRILVNDRVIIHNVNLRAEFQSIIVDLKEGRNVIEFEALNQGRSGPNTAQFRIFDQENNLLTENVWNLLTGARGTLVVIRDE